MWLFHDLQLDIAQLVNKIIQILSVDVSSASLSCCRSLATLSFTDLVASNFSICSLSYFIHENTTAFFSVCGSPGFVSDSLSELLCWPFCCLADWPSFALLFLRHVGIVDIVILSELLSWPNCPIFKHIRVLPKQK